MQAMKRGAGPTGISAITFNAAESTRETRLRSVEEIQTSPAPTTGTNEPSASLTDPAILLSAGSTRSSFP